MFLFFTPMLTIKGPNCYPKRTGNIDQTMEVKPSGGGGVVIGSIDPKPIDPNPIPAKPEPNIYKMIKGEIASFILLPGGGIATNLEVNSVKMLTIGICRFVYQYDHPTQKWTQYSTIKFDDLTYDVTYLMAVNNAGNLTNNIYYTNQPAYST